MGEMKEGDHNNELIHRMAETLRQHTEPYRPGAWEQFKAQYGQPKRTVSALVRYAGWVAAAMLLVVSGWFLFNQTPENNLDISRTAAESPRAQSGSKLREAEGAAQRSSQRTEESAPVVAMPTDRKESARRLALVNDEQETVPVSRVPSAEVAEIPVAAAETPLAEQRAAREEPLRTDRQAQADRPGPLEALPMEREAVRTARRHTGKWDLGLVVSPSLTTERVNMGGGITVAYRLSEKFSLSSGASIGEWGLAQQAGTPQYAQRASLDVNEPVTGNAGFITDASQYKEVTAVTSNVLALDIPLDLRYHFTDRFYTSAGISFVTILNEQRTNHFIDRINQPTFGEGNSSHKDPVASTQAVYSSERAGVQPLEGKGYAGFVNFSVGRTVPLSRRVSISLEPYFKLPVGRLSREDMDFTNGGIRIITGF